MKLAGFGLIVGLVGLLLGVDGLLFAGGVWIATGLLLRLLIQRGESSRSTDLELESEMRRIGLGGRQVPLLGVPGMSLLLICGLGSIVIGIASVGFPAGYEYLRWFPVLVGSLITLIGLISIPIELGKIKA